MRHDIVNKFNRGEIDPDAAMRIDVEKINNSGVLMRNWTPLRLGAMMHRPGWEYLDTVSGPAYFCSFVAAIDDLAQLEFTDESLRIWVDDAPVARTAVTSTVTNGTFDANITGWTDDSSGGGASAWEAGGYAKLTGDGSSVGAIYQEVTINEVDEPLGLRITIKDAPATVKIGYTSGATELFSGVLNPGVHSFELTPSANMFIHFANRKLYSSRIDAVEIEAAGDLTFDTDVTEANLELIRYAQSADVVFFACGGVKLFEVQRRGTRSWSIVDYRFEDGPFGVINVSGISMTPAALSGETTLTASDDYFRAGHVGALFRLGSAGQERTASVTAEDSGTQSIRVTGVDASRVFSIIVTGTWAASVTLQRSSDDAAWTDVETYTTNQSKTFDDGFDNAIFFYRLYVKTGNYTSGTVSLNLTYTAGSIEGVGRILGYTSPTVVDIQVLEAFGSTDSTLDWYEGEWSDVQGYPTALELYEGRLWLAGNDKQWGSISDAYRSFDDLVEGASATIRKTIGFGPVADVNWMKATTQLVMGLATDEILIRSSSFGEAITSANVNLRGGASQGSANISPVAADSRLYFVQRSQERIFESTYSFGSDALESIDITTLNPTVCIAGIKRIAVVRQPETRVYVVLNNGDVRTYMVEPSEDVRAWSRVDTAGGTVEDILVMPGVSEDRVYFLVNRTSGYCWEKMALQRDAAGGNVSKHFDGFVQYSSPGTTLTGLDHLEGEEVCVWADGSYRECSTVSSGSITVSASWTDVVAGLEVTAEYLSNKLNTVIEGHSTMAENKIVTRIGVIARDVVLSALKYGSDSTNVYDMPLLEGGTTEDQDVARAEYNELPFEFDSTSDPESQVYIKTTSPAKLLAMVYYLEDPDHTAISEG